MQRNHQTIKTTALGKIIISGEHAVVYGCPALAMAVNKTCHVTLEVLAKQSGTINFNLLNYNWQQSFSPKDLGLLQTHIEECYQKFLQEKVTHSDILGAATNFAPYIFVFFITHLLEVEGDVSSVLYLLSTGLNITVSSTIPVGFGMGSSAALIVAMGRAAEAYVGREVISEVFLGWSKEIENLQHGRSSGVDLYLAYHGGAVFFDEPVGVRTRDIAAYLPLRIINTGAAQSSTGACVEQAKQFFKKPGVLRDFTNVTLAVDKALQCHDYLTLQKCICENHKLLNYIGVVPHKVNAFIAEVEKRGLAAKISGAGAVSGDSAGMVLVFGEEEVEDLLVKYGYEKIKC
jgi:mevalonate kinase